MKLVLISDTHNNHNEVTLPKGDILIHAGDFTGLGRTAEIREFNKWLGLQKGRFDHILVIAGNHDKRFELDPTAAEEMLTNCTYLNQTSVVIDGVKFYGEPRTPSFGYGWVFNVDRHRMAEEVWSKVPDNMDVLITHGPPYGAGDRVDYDDGIGIDLFRTPPREQVGCRSQQMMIYGHPTLKLVVCGHIHEDNGLFEINGKTIANVSIANHGYRIPDEPTVLEI